MELRNLQTFLKVAQLLNFTQASRELGYSQSNVSAQIRQLEQELGTPLFNRIGKHVSLTQQGEMLLPYARQVADAASALESATRTEAELGGTVRFGIVESLYELLADEALLRYHARFPKVRIDLTVDASETLKAQAMRGRLDAICLIDSPLTPSDWRCQYRAEVPIVVVAGASHPLANRGTLTPEDLAEQEWVLMETEAPYNSIPERVMAAHGLSMRTFLRLQSTQTARRLAQRGPFLTLLPQYSVRKSLERGDLAQLNVPELQQTQQVQLALHLRRNLSPQLEGLLQICADVLREHIPD